MRSVWTLIARESKGRQAMRRFMYSLAGILFLLTFMPISAPVNGYNISAKGAVHERITRLAEYCAKLEPMPVRCSLPRTQSGFSDVDWKSGTYTRAVRWPDDPTHQGNILGIVKFAINAGLGKCVDYLNPGQPFAGLMCNSHYGKFQFMHAMSSSDKETNKQTRELILAWSKFTFGVASRRIPADAPFCETVRMEGGPLAEVLAPKEFPYCEDRVTARATYPAWKVRTLFVLSCRNPFSSATCSEAIGDPANELARRNATGALLHLIQDSFSRSHASRAQDNARGPYLSQIDCAPVRKFYLYSLNKRYHGAADKPPVFSPECGDQSRILDPITASARILRGIAVGDQSAEIAAVRMIEDEVLGVPPQV